MLPITKIEQGINLNVQRNLPVGKLTSRTFVSFFPGKFTVFLCIYSCLPIRCCRVLRQGTISAGSYSVVPEIGKKIAEIHAKVEPFSEERNWKLEELAWNTDVEEELTLNIEVAT